MDFGAVGDWVSAFPVLTNLLTFVRAFFIVLPWIGTALFALAAWNPGGFGDKLLAGVRDWLKTTKSVAQDQTAEIQEIKAQVALILETIKPKA